MEFNFGISPPGGTITTMTMTILNLPHGVRYEVASGKRYLLHTAIWGLDISLQSLLLRPGFYQSCEHWRSRTVDKGVLHDVL